MPPQIAATNEAGFSSRKAAEDFLARAIPQAISANPKYRSKKDNVETIWLTKSIEFGDGSPGRGVQVTMDEDFTEIRGGVPTHGTHQAVFDLGEVSVSMHADESDVAETGGPALGIIFNCVAPKCIQAKWNGQPSSSDWTDIYLQDGTLRARILAAFAFLKSSGPKSPS